MDELSKHVSNAELVTSVVGSWPDLHDAEVLSVELKRDGRPSVVLTIKAIPYDPSGKTGQALLQLLFKDVEEVELRDFNEQNVVWNLFVEPQGPKRRLVISPTYGLGGGLLFSEAEVLRAEALG